MMTVWGTSNVMTKVARLPRVVASHPTSWPPHIRRRASITMSKPPVAETRYRPAGRSSSRYRRSGPMAPWPQVAWPALAAPPDVVS